MYVVVFENNLENAVNMVELDNSDVEAVDVDDPDTITALSGGNAGTDDYATESVSGGDSSAISVYEYTEEQREVDSEIVERLTDLNGTCSLLLFFLLFAWIDRKVRFFMKGFGNGKSN